MTTTALAAYGRVHDVQSFIRELGENIAKSQMFGCENVQQGYVLATACVAKGKDPLTLAEDYHIIHGRLSMRADRMLAGLMERGGKYRVISRTADAACIEISYDGQTHQFSLTWDEAKHEPFTKRTDRKTGQEKISDSYATPRKRMQMLWARVVSDGVRTMCPVVLSGRYTPEELGDDHETEPTEEAEYVVVAESVSPSPTTGEPTITETPRGSATHAAIAEIKTLYDALEVPHEKRDDILRKYGTGSLLSLSQEQADELLGKLRAKLNATREPAQSVDGPCSVEQSERIKRLLAEVCQVAGYEETASRVKAMLERASLKKLTDLSIAEAERLERALSLKQMEAFFEQSLTGYQPKN